MKWQLKAALQTAFSLLPGGERLNYLAQLLSGSHRQEVLYDEFVKTRQRLQSLKKRVPFERGVVVEVGTGWIGVGILSFFLEGAREVHSYDLEPHLRFRLLKDLAKAISTREPEYAERLEPLLRARTLNQFLAAANARYHAPADASRTGLDDHSVDLVFSQNVLEHVSPEALERIVAESARILRGRAYHSIGLHDHLAATDSSISGVHFLGLSPMAWRLVNNRISYHNRLRAPHYIELFDRHRGRITNRDQVIQPSDLAALGKLKLQIFQHMKPEDLAVTRLEVDVEFEQNTRA